MSLWSVNDSHINLYVFLLSFTQDEFRQVYQVMYGLCQCHQAIKSMIGFEYTISHSKLTMGIHFLGLPKYRPITKHHHYLSFVVVDILSRMATLNPFQKTARPQESSQLLFENFWKHYGLLNTIICDKYSIFFNNLWEQLWQQLDTQLSMSIAFHP